MIHSLDVAIKDERWLDIVPDPDIFCERIISEAARPLTDPQKGELSIALVSAAEMRGLNAAYRAKDKPTNVLSFPASGPVPMLGDIIISRETVISEAELAGITAQDHTSHLLVHGYLHLQGYDHQSDSDADIMEALEVGILRGLNIDNPYKINERSYP